MTEWQKEKKVALEPKEVVMVAHAALVSGVDQHTLSGMYGVNQGRINEAISIIREVAENHMEYYRLMKKNGKLHE